MILCHLTTTWILFLIGTEQQKKQNIQARNERNEEKKQQKLIIQKQVRSESENKQHASHKKNIYFHPKNSESHFVLPQHFYLPTIRARNSLVPFANNE